MGFLVSCNDEGELVYSQSDTSVVYMWESTTTTNGDIGGVNGATTICETDASGIAGLAAGLTHRAVIATAANDPRSYTNNNRPVQRPDGTPITDTYADFFDRNVTASNSVVTASSSRFSWTGIAITGGPSAYHCQNWTSAAITDLGNRNNNATPTRYRFQVTDSECDNIQHILCISY